MIFLETTSNESSGDGKPDGSVVHPDDGTPYQLSLIHISEPTRPY